MKKSQKSRLIIAIMLLVNICYAGLFLGSNTNFKNTVMVKNDINPVSADVIQEPIQYSDIYRNDTILELGFESINFTLDISNYLANDANRTSMQIDFSNGTSQIFNMTQISTINYTYTYTPRALSALGTHSVSFKVFNHSVTEKTWIQLNNQTTFSNFTVISNCMAFLNSSTYYRGDIFHADITVNGFSSYDWTLAIFDPDKQNKFDLGENLYQVQFEINETFDIADEDYYLKVNLTRKSDGKWIDLYFHFTILNKGPQIVESTIDFSPSSFFRTDNVDLRLNVTDEENSNDLSQLTVKFNLLDPNGEKAFDDKTLSYDADGPYNFKTNFVVPAAKPAGNYRVTITVTDSNDATDTYSQYITVKNNPPEINSYEVNNFTMDESVSINYGEDLIFTFNATDKEDGLRWVKVALLNEDDEWYNITREYKDDMSITVRTVELITGKWFVYVYVIDADGAIVGLDFDYDTAPQEITVVPDIISTILPWVAFFIGIGIGAAFGFAIGYFRLARKKVPVEKIEKKPARKKPSKKSKISKPKKAPIKKEKTETKPKEEKKEKKSQEPKVQRKIKRRL